MKGRLLVVAGSDSGGGAGIQADIKSASSMGAYTMTAITALTAQDTHRVHALFPVPAALVEAQIRAPLEDIGVDAVKTGMLYSGATIRSVARLLDTLAPHVPLVADPVMVGKGGDVLLRSGAVKAFQRHILPRAFLLTPNLPEAERLLCRPVRTEKDMREAGERLLASGARSVLVKGGHLDSPRVVDLLITENGAHRFEGPRIPSRNTHGTGCTLASAIAACLAQGIDLVPAVDRARNYVFRAIREAPALGGGHGPLNHLVSSG